MKYLIILFTTCLLNACSTSHNKVENPLEIRVLGVAQDAGYPQINCEKPCCKAFYEGKRAKQRVCCLGIIDRDNKKSFLVEATPDIVSQWQSLKDACPECEIAGILITHAHIGHYTGLMHLGKEALNAQQLAVYVLPKMAEFLTNNGPWSQLIKEKNIALKVLTQDSVEQLTNKIQIMAFAVPHRDEFSETAGFKIISPTKNALFIPDIDKWQKWDKNIVDEVKKVDYAFLDATFYDEKELPGRNMAEIPHPFVVESFKLFGDLAQDQKAKIHFIHFNHTNELLDLNSKNCIFAANLGFGISFDGLALIL